MTDSWRLKVDRAEQHLGDLKREIDRYAEQHAYKAVHHVGGVKCHEHPDCWRYRLQITQEPDPWLAILAGDVVHNLRSALDHIAVALVPSSRRYKASFPIRMEDPWVRENGRYVAKPETRRSFNTAVKGMPAAAITAIKELQPYKEGPDARIHLLAQLSTLENADKHRQLIPFAAGLRRVASKVTARGQVLYQTFPTPRHFIPDGAQIAHFGWRIPPPLAPSEVNVEVRGTPLVAIKVIQRDRSQKGLPGWSPTDELLRHIVEGIREEVFPALEPFARRR